MSVVPSSAAMTAAFNTRVVFVIELARKLHQYGTAAPRLEDAVSSAAQRLGLRADVFSSPTAIILSFADMAQGEDGVAQVTQVIRLAPGDVNLARLCDADAIADGVIDGRIGIEDGARELRALSTPLTPAQRRGMVFGYGLAAAAFAALIHTSWPDIVVAGVVGWLIGAVVLVTSRRPHPVYCFTLFDPLRAKRAGQGKAQCAGKGHSLGKRCNAAMARPLGSRRASR